MTENHVALAEEFLREAVYRSRAGQAVSTLLAKASSPDRGQCGLGEKAAIALDLSPRAQELFDELFGSTQADAARNSRSSSREVSSASPTPSGSTASRTAPASPDSPAASTSDAAEAALLERLHARMRAWIEAQDALDRERNHFLKAFRKQHGFDRTKYSAAEIAEFESGLAHINDEENRERRSAALRLLEA